MTFRLSKARDFKIWNKSALSPEILKFWNFSAISDKAALLAIPPLYWQ